jgi:hypothetical protein
MPSKARLVATRTNPRDIKMRDLYVQVVGHGRERTLLWDEQFTWELDPGMYELHVHNRLYKRVVKVELKPDQEHTVLVANVATGCFAVLFLIAGMGPYRVEARIT